MATNAELIQEFLKMSRPKILVTTARMGAKQYRRERDLPGAVPGLMAKPNALIIPNLVAAEQQCENDRRSRSAAYRSGRHVQILSALLAETAGLVQAKASGSEFLRSAT